MATNGSAVLTQATPAQKKTLAGAVVSTPFSYEDRLYRSYTEFDTVFEYSDLDLYQIRQMLSQDGTPRKLEQVLSLPLRGAPWELRGGGPALDLVKANLGPLIPGLIDQATSAFAYQKAFFEVEWELDDAQVIYKKLHMRPASSCEAAWTTAGDPNGFRQQLAPMALFAGAGDLGWARIEANRSFIYTHGTHREPLKGLSDLDVSLWCWGQIKKLQFLWFQYLESQSLPKMLVYGDSDEQARGNAQAIAKGAASAVIPVEWRGDPAQRSFDILESSGKGAHQFQAAISYLESRQTGSVLASFMDLAQHASVGGRGSNALSADQSEFYLASREAVAGEMAAQITDGVVRPLVVLNYGPDVEVPSLHIGPIGNRQTDRALGLLTGLVTAPTVNLPTEFVGELLNHVATFLGLESDKVAAIVDTWQADQAAKAAAAAPVPPPGGQLPLPGTETLPAEAKLSRAIGLAHELVTRVTNGVDPDDALRELTPKRRRPGPKPNGAPKQLQVALAAESPSEHTGGMVALFPDSATAKRLAVSSVKAEPAEDLHLTLAFLGKDVTGWDDQQRQTLVDIIRSTVAAADVVDARVFAHTTFNADGGPDGTSDPCAVYGIGDTDRLGPLRDAIMHAIAQRKALPALPDQHEPFVPHVTGGYGMTAADLSYLGPVRFDRIVVALADDRTEMTLTPGNDRPTA